jgi:hypothetical protein
MNPLNITPSYFSKIHFILSTHLRLGLPSGHFPSGSPTKILYAFLFSLCVLSALSIILNLLLLIVFREKWKYGAPHAVFSARLSLHPFWFQIFSSAPSSQTPSVYVPTLMSQTKFHRQNYSVIYSDFYMFRQQSRRREVVNWMVP